MSTKNIILANASVAQPNTPETDLMESVLHEVEIYFSDSTSHKAKISARCPMHAIELVKSRLAV
jgi:hypothetical protein